MRRAGLRQDGLAGGRVEGGRADDPGLPEGRGQRQWVTKPVEIAGRGDEQFGRHVVGPVGTACSRDRAADVGLDDEAGRAVQADRGPELVLVAGALEEPRARLATPLTGFTTTGNP